MISSSLTAAFEAARPKNLPPASVVSKILAEVTEPEPWCQSQYEAPEGWEVAETSTEDTRNEQLKDFLRRETQA